MQTIKDNHSIGSTFFINKGDGEIEAWHIAAIARENLYSGTTKGIEEAQPFLYEISHTEIPNDIDTFVYGFYRRHKKLADMEKEIEPVVVIVCLPSPSKELKNTFFANLAKDFGFLTDLSENEYLNMIAALMKNVLKEDLRKGGEAHE